VAGLLQDLKLTEKQYQICLTTLFIPYLLSEVPSNLLLRVIGPRRLLPSLLSIWGVITCLQGERRKAGVSQLLLISVLLTGFVTGFKGLLAVRFFLGMVEGPMLPAIFLYLSDFYTRSELGLRCVVRYWVPAFF
jgi:MFS family permease